MVSAEKAKPAWRDVKAKLDHFDRAALLGLIKDLHGVNSDNEAFLCARLGLGSDPLEPYRKTISRWICPDVMKGQNVSVAKAKKAISDYKKAIGLVAPVDVLVGMGLLRPEHLGNWRRGRLPYLERVINCNLTRLSRLLRILRFHTHDLNLKPSATAYNRYGKGPKQRLRFSKAGDAGLEATYATHFVWPGKRPFHSPRAEPVAPPDAL